MCMPFIQDSFHITFTVHFYLVATRIWSNPYDGQIRLTGGDTVNKGLVEIYCNGQWGTVCNEKLDGDDANTMCRQLGYATAFDYDHLTM